MGRLQQQPSKDGRKYLNELASQALIQHGPGRQAAEGHGRLAIVLNKRLMSVAGFYDRLLKDMDNPQWSGGYRLVASGETKSARLFLLEAPSLSSAQR